MGIDVMFHVRLDNPEHWSEDSIRALVEATTTPDWTPTPLVHHSTNEASYIELSMMERYWGPGYQRGRWPIIRDFGDALVQLTDPSRVAYLPDSDDRGYWEPSYLFVHQRAQLTDMWNELTPDRAIDP